VKLLLLAQKKAFINFQSSTAECSSLFSWVSGESFLSFHQEKKAFHVKSGQTFALQILFPTELSKMVLLGRPFSSLC